MVVRWDQLYMHLVLFYVFLSGFGALVIHDVEHWVVLSCLQNMEDFHEGSDKGCVSAVWHWANHDGIKVINICNKYVLHIFEGSNRKHPGDIRVDSAGRGIGEGDKAKHIVYCTCFVDGEHIVDLGACKKDASVVVVGGCSVGLMAMYMAFVGGGKLRQTGANQISRDTGDGFQFSALGEGEQE